jgi:hypothetical protein
LGASCAEVPPREPADGQPSAATSISGTRGVELPPAGRVPAESIRECEDRVARVPDIQRFEHDSGADYAKVDVRGDSFFYSFTGPTEAAHPAMLVITIHPMADPVHPQEHEVEFHGSYAGSEEAFVAWQRRVSYEFGRGFAHGVREALEESSTDGSR